MKNNGIVMQDAGPEIGCQVIWSHYCRIHVGPETVAKLAKSLQLDVGSELVCQKVWSRYTKLIAVHLEEEQTNIKEHIGSLYW